MNTILSAVDAVLCSLVILAAIDYLRRIHPLEQPLLALSFYLVAVSAFAVLAAQLRGHAAHPAEVSLHAGIVTYAWARRHHIFVWRGQERRKAETR